MNKVIEVIDPSLYPLMYENEKRLTEASGRGPVRRFFSVLSHSRWLLKNRYALMKEIEEYEKAV